MSEENRNIAAEMCKTHFSNVQKAIDFVEKKLDQAEERGIKRAAEVVETACKQCDEPDCYSKAILGLLNKQAGE